LSRLARSLLARRLLARSLLAGVPAFFCFVAELQGREQTLPFRLLSFSYFDILPVRHIVINEYD
jgi:hypothetical protein